ncbi:MAG: hypothetical protein NDJ90_14895 [Oligoflexia bacterium]|nr:hypothetical protein [Oligoflexia bacterium]
MKKTLSFGIMLFSLSLVLASGASAGKPAREVLLQKSESTLVSGNVKSEHVVQKFDCVFYNDGAVTTRMELTKKVGAKAGEPVVPVIESDVVLATPFQVEQVKQMIEAAKEGELKEFDRFFASSESKSYVAVAAGRKTGEKILLSLYQVEEDAKVEKTLVSPYTGLLMQSFDAFCGH